MSSLYALSTEQESLRAVLRDLLRSRPSARAVYDGAGTSPDLELWRELVALGAAGLGIAEADGGSGGDLVDQLVVAEELGRVVAPVPFVAAAVAAAAIGGAADGPARSTWLAAIAQGTERAGVILDDPALAYDCAGATLLVVATPDGGLAVVEGPEVEVLPSIDRTRPVAHCRWAADAVLPLATTWSRGTLVHLQRALYAAEAVGVAAEALDRTARYTQDRRQFGLPIGTFQAVKHRLADMLVDVECARSAAHAAMWALRDGSDGALAAHLAQAVATEAATRVVSGAIQLHGGIGVTWEHDLHLHLRRAKSLELAHGAPGWHYDRIAEALLGPARAT